MSHADASALERRRTLLGAAAVVVCLWAGLALVHPEVMLGGKVYGSSDAQAAAAFQTVGDRALEAGEFPHWNPFVFVGMPSYASLAYTPGAYPLTRPLQWLRETLGLVPMTWLFVHLFLAALGTAGWLRWRGHSWAVAATGGALLVTMPHVIAWAGYGHGTKVGSFAWIPFALWSTEAWLKTGRLVWVAALAGFVSLQLLRGHVQIAYYGVIGVAFWVGFLALPDLRVASLRRSRLLRIGLIAAAGLVALGAALVLYLPVLEYQPHSIRGSGQQGGGAAWDYATNWSLSWPELSTLWWPTAAGYGQGSYVGGMPFTDYPNYVGLPLLLLAAIGLALRRDRWTWCVLAFGVFALLVSLGKNGFLYRVLYEALPGFKKFRVPVMILILQQLATVLLGMRGLEELLRRVGSSAENRPRWLGRPLLIAALTLGIVLLLLGTVGASSLREMMFQRWEDMARHFQRGLPPGSVLAGTADRAVADALRMGAVIVAATLAVLAHARGRLPREAAAGVVGLLLFLDLWRVDQPLLHPERHQVRLARQGERVVSMPSPAIIRDLEEYESYTDELPVTAWLKSQEERPRVWPLGRWAEDNRLAAREVVSLGGYHAAKLKVYEDARRRLFDPQNPQVQLATLLGARWTLAPSDFGEGTFAALRARGVDLDPDPRWTGEAGVVYENRAALPDAWMVGGFALESPGEDTTAREPTSDVLERVLQPDFDPRREAILSAAPDVVPDSRSEGASVRVVERRYNGSRWRVETPGSGVLVFNEIWYPEWKVTVDGEPARLLRANHLQRAVALDAGAHEIEMRYAASAFERGRWSSRIAWSLIFIGLVFEPLRRRLRRGDEANGGGAKA